jgi:single-strand selective monofunctional uracil DNA glycosylase
MAQVGVPFGEIETVKTWLGIEAKIDKPENEHPRRPVTGFNCPKSEVSGRRLWGLFKERFHTADAFFREHIVMNYCPLVFMADSGANITPDKIAKQERGPLFDLCDRHLERIVEIFEPEWCIGIGNFAEKRLLSGVKASSVRVGRILHPSPASPAANQDWAGKATQQLVELGVWRP